MSLRTLPTRFAAALVAVGDPSRDRTVYATIVLLVALGFTMIMLAVWLLRNTRPDPDVLAPLERMGQRKWRRADPVWQRRHLDEVRPGGADPLETMSAPPAHDAEFERGPQPIGFDDLVASSTTTVVDGSGLPAPAPGAVAVEGPAEVDAGDAPAADDAVAGASEADGDQTDDGATDDAAPDGEASGAGDDEQDDEDITGEQDTDDFLAVLDTEHDVDEDGDLEAETESGDADADADAESTSEPDGDSDDEPDVEPDVEPVSEPDVEPAGESEVDANDEPAVDPVEDPDGESEVDAEDEPAVDPSGDADGESAGEAEPVSDPEVVADETEDDERG